MSASIRLISGAVLLAAAGASPLAAQQLHTNTRWEECSIVLDPSLNQASWHQFVAEVGQVAYFRPMTSARSLGRGNVEVAATQWNTQIDRHDDAWNDTFSHPDSAHHLFEGDALPIIGLMGRVGVSDRVDVGVYWTENWNANYGFLGGQLQYGLMDEVDAPVTAALRGSAVIVYGPDDADLGVYGVDLVASRRVSFVEPYVVVSGFLSRGNETTNKVDLDDESVFGTQATFGIAADIWALRIGAEYNVARVGTYSMKIGFAI
jgi:hypothetical protein